MKRSIFFPVALILVFIFIVSAACNFSFGDNAAETEEPQVIVITATPETKESDVASDEVVVEEDTTEDQDSEDTQTEDLTTVNESQPYYVEEFDGDLENYEFFYIDIEGSDPDKGSIYPEDGTLVFDYNGDYLWSYITYEPYVYDDVRIDMQAENLASSNNSITLVCRYDEDLGWYEYNIDNDGEWTLYYYDNVIAKDYIQLYDGGSTNINMGRDTNTYTMICQGQELSLYINGVFTHSFEHKDLKKGQVGFGVSSYANYPVKVNVNWFEISEP